MIEANSQAVDSKALERSQEVFELMEKCRRQGDIKPNERVYTSFIRALAKGKSKNLHKKAYFLLQKMRELYEAGNEGIKPTVFTYNAVLHACSESLHIEGIPRLDAFKVAVTVFNEMRKDNEELDHVTFGNMLRCASLLPEGEKRNALIETTFRLCCESGFVNSYVIRDLQNSAPEELWRSLLGRPEGDVEMESLPAKWSYKFERRREKSNRRSR